LYHWIYKKTVLVQSLFKI